MTKVLEKSTQTIITSATSEVTISPNSPFCVIGERINPTGRDLLMEEMKAGDFSRVEAEALAQVEAGANMLDINAGIPLADEAAILAKAIQVIQAITDVPLVIDSSIIDALEAGLSVYQGKALVNSVTGEEESLERVLPLVKKYDASVVVISNDDNGISEDPRKRLEVAKKIINRAADYGISKDRVLVDPLVMPISAVSEAAKQVFYMLQVLRDEYKVNSTCGASNISFGLPNRRAINASFLTAATSHGLTSAIMNPLHSEDMTAIRGANVMNALDDNCQDWIKNYRKPTADKKPTRGRRRHS